MPVFINTCILFRPESRRSTFLNTHNKRLNKVKSHLPLAERKINSDPKAQWWADPKKYGFVGHPSTIFGVFEHQRRYGVPVRLVVALKVAHLASRAPLGGDFRVPG